MFFAPWTKLLRLYLQLPLELALIASTIHTGAVASRLESRSTTPAPLVIPASQAWDGNDGPWSSFAIQVGTPAQSLKILISTAGTQTWAIATEGCQSGDPTDCKSTRGGLYNYNNSVTWAPNKANVSTPIYDLGFESNLGYSGKGRYGFDDITLGFQGGGGPSLKNQTLAGVAAKDFYMGIFGLTPRPSGFTADNITIPSFMENLKNQSLIPSLSWAYTAGNQYRSSGVFGSLTLGGYDTSKFIANSVSFLFNADNSRDLTVQIKDITSGTTSLLPTSIPTTISAFLDSTIPYIYLPIEACTLFENTFGIIWNDTSELYLINDTQHTLLQAKNPSIQFSLGNAGSSETANITLPYAALALKASSPLATPDARYFPLKRAANDSQYTLGRTFFQEAYVIADYERQNFSVSQCNWDAKAVQNIVTITSPSSPSKKLSTGAIAGIAVGGAAVIIGLVLLYFFWLKPRQKQKAVELEANQAQANANASATQEFVKPELDSTQVVNVPGDGQDDDPAKRVPLVEMGIPEPVYEMAAREEVAAEMTGLSSPTELDSARNSSRRWGRRKRRGNGRESGRSSAMGSFAERSPVTDLSYQSSVSSGWRSEPQSLGSTPVLSPVTPASASQQRQYRPYRVPE